MSALREVLALLEERNVFLTGGAGVGKSYMTKEIIADYKSDYRGVVVLGSTGISAVNVGGQTIHSFFAFGIASNFEQLNSYDRYNKSRLKELAKLLEKTDLIVIDEISMVSADLMDMIQYRLRAAKYTGRVLVVGDFYQLPPVQKGQNNALFGENIYAFESSSWEMFDFVNVELTKIKRTSNEEFMQILEKIRVGELDSETLAYLSELRGQNESLSEATVLYGRNYEADQLNQRRIAEVNRQAFSLPSVVESKTLKKDDKRLLSWKKNLPIIDDLVLKEGIPVIFTTNKWGSYHNGERAFVEHVDKDHIVVEKEGKLVKVDRFSFEMSHAVLNDKGDMDNEVLCTLEQFPLRPAYAITIHKSQGMSLAQLVCNVDHIFADSQFYVALSRAIDPKSLQISFSRGDFENYLRRVIRVSENVKSYYENSHFVRLD